jgi:hypothetical protein
VPDAASTPADPGRDDPAISARGLSKRFGDRVAFGEVSFEIGHGEVFGFSARASDPRTAAQLSMLMSLPTVAVTTLVAFNIIPATFGVAIALGTALLVLVGLGWWFASAIFDRERLVTSTK